jgi:hypothetical protein
MADGDFQGASHILILMYNRFLETSPSPTAKSEVMNDVVQRQTTLMLAAAKTGNWQLTLTLFFRLRLISYSKLGSLYAIKGAVRALVVLLTNRQRGLSNQ